MSVDPAAVFGAPSDDASTGSGTPSPQLSKAELSAVKKRTSTSTSTEGGAAPVKVTKRRAARACVSCRARKVRCDVVEGAPCGNCRWDNVEVRHTNTQIIHHKSQHIIHTKKTLRYSCGDGVNAVTQGDS